MSLFRNAGITVSVLALLVCLSGQSAPASGSQRKIRVLIVDGFSNHDWRLTTELLRGILEPSGLFEVSVCTAPAAAVSPGWEQWKPSFSDYDVVISNLQRYRRWFKSTPRNQNLFSFSNFCKPCNHPNLYVAVEIRENCG